MDVYLESNYVLELSLLQEQVNSCKEILKLAEKKQIQLIIPAYSFSEPYEAQYRREKRRGEFAKKLSNEFDNLSRSKSYKEQKGKFKQIIDLLISSQEEEKSRLDEIISKLADTAEIISLTEEIIIEALSLKSMLDLSPQDSLVLASIQDHLKKNNTVESCFINRDSKDFNDPDIVEKLSQMKCKMIFNFKDGIGFINSIINS